MSALVVDLVFGSATAVLGAAAAWVLCRLDVYRTRWEQASSKARHAAEVLNRLLDLTARMAIDVGQHSSQVEEINEQLASAGDSESAKIVNVVADLIQANQQMREKLATTEDRLREQAQQIEIHATEARTDALTLLANRRALDDELARRFAELRRLGRSFSLIMADMDHFKNLNDAHGHQTGDEVLRSVAGLLRRTMREMDLVARYGGEEFAIVLPGTNFDDACEAALRAGEAVEKARFRYGGKELRVTASLGVAEASNDESGAALLMRADVALYASKQGGRNCTHGHDGRGIRRVDRTVPRVEPPKIPQRSLAEAGQGAGVEPPPAVSDLPSRTAFCQQVRNRIAEWKLGGPVFSVLLAEVNEYGPGPQRHDTPQREMATLALTKQLAAAVPEMDVIGHYAPGCLALLLPSVGTAEAVHIAERLREGFPQPVASPDAAESRLALNVGVAQVAHDDDTIALLKRAEAALEAVDRHGRDLAYLDDGECCAPMTAILEAVDSMA